MDLKLNVDVHVAAGEDGLMLVVGGLIKPIKGTELEAIIRGPKLKKRQKAAAPFAKGPGLAADSRAERRAKGQCSWCDGKPVAGKRLCEHHLAGARKNAKKACLGAKKARLGKKRAA